MNMERSAAGARSRDRGTGRASGTIRISLLGGFRITEGGEDRDLPKAVRRLLALLALNRLGLPRSDAAALLTPHLGAQSARASLRTTLSRLRATGPDVVEADGARLRLVSGVRVDTWELEDRAAGVAAPPASPDPDHYERLVSGLLPGWEDPWVTLRRERVHGLTLVELEADTRRAAANGDLDRASFAAGTAVRIDPLRDSSVRALIDVHLARGNSVDALRTYHAHYRRLKQEVGTEPPEATTALVAPMLGSVLWKRLERRWRPPR